jgi:hypothetical protein
MIYNRVLDRGGVVQQIHWYFWTFLTAVVLNVCLQFNSGGSYVLEQVFCSLIEGVIIGLPQRTHLLVQFSYRRWILLRSGLVSLKESLFFLANHCIANLGADFNDTLTMAYRWNEIAALGKNGKDEKNKEWLLLNLFKHERLPPQAVIGETVRRWE